VYCIVFRCSVVAIVGSHQRDYFLYNVAGAYLTEGVQGFQPPSRARGDPWDSRKSSRKCASEVGGWLREC